jgi:hypothetical protein
VCFVAGADVPYILRRANGETFTLVGEAYVHGAMHGEIMVKETVSAREMEIV